MNVMLDRQVAPGFALLVFSRTPACARPASGNGQPDADAFADPPPAPSQAPPPTPPPAEAAAEGSADTPVHADDAAPAPSLAAPQDHAPAADGPIEPPADAPASTPSNGQAEADPDASIEPHSDIQEPEPPVAWAAATLQDLLHDLRALHDQGRLPNGFEVAVLGLAAGRDGQPDAGPRLDNGAFYPLAELPADTATAWEPVAAAPAEALTEAHALVRRWLQRHPEAGPPLVVHCHDGAGLDDHHARACRNLRMLATRHGPLTLFNCAFPPADVRLSPGVYGGGEPAPWPAWWGRSSPLPAVRPGRRGLPQHGLAVNAPRPARRMVRRLFHNQALPQAEAPALEPPACAFEVHSHLLVKNGNADNEYEDAAADAPAQGLFAVADGAGEGIFCRRWAHMLCEAFTRQPPDLANRQEQVAWLAALRKTWREAINFPNLRGTQQAKVLDVGAAATLLGLRFLRPEPGAEMGEVAAWQAVAAGDSCLFWIRDNHLHAVFPMTASDQFALGPALFRTRLGLIDPVPLLAAGACRAGDLFLLTTDAVAQTLLWLWEKDPEHDWDAWATQDDGTWRERIGELRRSGEMVNDDCTLLAVRVTNLAQSNL